MIKWNPSEYDKNSAQLEKWAKDFVSKFALLGTERILDIGSGDGKITSEISKSLTTGRITGIDSSEEMIEYSRKKFDKSHYPKLEFVLMDARNVQFINEFGIVFSVATFHWLTDHKQLLEQVKKVLKPSGKLFLQMGGYGNQQEMVDLVEKTSGNGKWRKYFDGFKFKYGYYSVEDYRKWIKETNLIEKRIELVNLDNILKGKEGVEKWIKLAFSPYVQKLTDNEASEFIDEITGKFTLTNKIDDKGNYHLGMIRLEVEAMKK